MTAARLVTHDGRKFDADWEHELPVGRTVYRCFGGAFALSSPDAGSADTYAGTTDVQVTYGSIGDRWSFGYETRPDAPEFFGIRLLGASVFRLESMDPCKPWQWITPRRPLASYCSQSVPDGTRRRVAGVVAAIVEHWIGLPDYGAVRHAHDVMMAPGRLSSRTTEIQDLTQRIKELEAQRAEHMRHADILAVLAAEAEEVTAGE